MATITFLYRLHSQAKAFYGKIILPSIPDQHKGLDTIVRSIVFEGINLYRTAKKLNPLTDSSTLSIGVLSLMNQHIEHCTTQEISCFDFYYIQSNNETGKYYINGKELQA